MYRKTIVFILTWGLTVLMSSANAQKRVSDKIYWLALEKYTLALDSNYHSGSTAFKEKVIYLQKPDCIDSIPTQINGYDIIEITSQNQQKLYRDHGNVLVHTKMFPVAVEDSLLHITITPYSGTLKRKRNYYLSVSDGTTVYFRYDDRKKQFVIFKVNNWGI